MLRSIDQRVRDNRRSSTAETASEVSVMKGNTRCKNGLRPPENI